MDYHSFQVILQTYIKYCFGNCVISRNYFFHDTDAGITWLFNTVR